MNGPAIGSLVAGVLSVLVLLTSLATVVLSLIGNVLE